MHPQHQRIALCFPVTIDHVGKIQACVPEWEVVDAGQDRIATEILDADIFCGHAKVPVPWPEVVSQGKLRWIQSSAAGMDHCLVPEVVASDIVVSSASGLFADQVAEQTLALLLGMIRSMPTFYRAQQQKDFTRRPTDDLHGKTVGIVGFGGNGRRIAETLAPMKVRILATDLFPETPPAGVESIWPADRLHELLAAADVVILCIPLNQQTRRLMGPAEFDRMKQGSYFINVARGQVVDESALVDALTSQHLRSAGLDVTETEPLPASSPLWQMPQVIITPHVGAQSADRVDLTVDFFCENLLRFAADRQVINLVDKQLGFPIPEHRPPR